MDFKSLNKEDLEYFLNLLGKEYLNTDQKTLEEYGKDYTEDFMENLA